MKLPAIQFYPADWRKDPAVQALNFHDRGVWFEILCLMHESSERGVLLLNGIPMPEDALARMLGLDKQILTTTLTTLLTYGAAKRRDADGAIYSSRMVKDEKIIQIRREAGKKGGNPLLLNQNPTTGVNQITTPSSSSSSSSSTTDKSNIKKKRVADAPLVFPSCLNNDTFKKVWNEYLEYRKASKMRTLQQNSLKLLLQQMAIWGSDGATQALKTTISNGWTGVFEPKFTAAPATQTTNPYAGIF